METNRTACRLPTVQKDDLPHSYLWTANTSEGGSDMEIAPGNTSTDAVFLRKAGRKSSGCQ